MYLCNIMHSVLHLTQYIPATLLPFCFLAIQRLFSPLRAWDLLFSLPEIILAPFSLDDLFLFKLPSSAQMSHAQGAFSLLLYLNNISCSLYHITDYLLKSKINLFVHLFMCFLIYLLWRSKFLESREYVVIMIFYIPRVYNSASTIIISWIK